jgi:hypothetical protein
MPNGASVYMRRSLANLYGHHHRINMHPKHTFKLDALKPQGEKRTKICGSKCLIDISSLSVFAIHTNQIHGYMYYLRVNNNIYIHFTSKDTTKQYGKLGNY